MNREANHVVHLELHTGDLGRACEFYARVCGWRPERIAAAGRTYLALEMGNGLGGGVTTHFKGGATYMITVGYQMRLQKGELPLNRAYFLT